MTEIQSTLERAPDDDFQAPEIGQLAVDTAIKKEDVLVFGVEGIFSLETDFTAEDIVSLVAVSKSVLSEQTTEYGKEEADRIIDSAEQSISDTETVEFNPQVVIAVLNALRHDGVTTYKILGDEKELERVCSSEQAFKRYIASNLLNSPNGATTSPAMYRLFMGRDSFNSAIQQQAEKSPGMILAEISKILKVSPESKGLVRHCFDTLVKADRPFSLANISSELADIVGLDRVASIIDKYLESPDAAYDYELSNFDRLVDEGLVDAERVIDTIIANINFSYNTIGLLNSLISKSEDLRERFIPKLQSQILRLVSDINIEPGILQSSVNSVLGFSSVEELFDPEFQKNFVDVVTSIQPIEKIKYLGNLKRHMSEEEFSEICNKLVDKFHDLPDEAGLAGNEDLKDYAEDILDALMDREVFQSLSEQQQIDIASKIFELLPHKMTEIKSYKGSQLPENVLATMKKSLMQALLSLEEEVFVTNFEAIIGKFNYSDQEIDYLKKVLVSKAQFVNPNVLLKNRYVLDAIGDEGILSIIESAIEDNAKQSFGYFDMHSVYKSILAAKGYEFARDNVLEKLIEHPESIAYILAENFSSLPESDRSRYLEFVVNDSRAAVVFLSDVADSAVLFELSSDDLINLCQHTISDDSKTMYSKLHTLKKIDATLHKEFSLNFKEDFLKLNPIELFSEIKNLPPGMFTDARAEIIDFIENDPVAQQMPKYFAHVLRRLENMPEGDGAIVLAKEASLAYDKAKTVYENPQLKSIYERLYESAPSKKAKTELEAITYSKILGQIGYEKTAEVGTISESQIVIIESIYKKLGIQYPDTLDLEDTASKVGELYPFIVLGSSVVEGTDFAEYYKSIVQATLDGSFKEWKYRKESRQLLIDHSMLPDITQSQYDIWSENEESESRDILLNDADSVSKRLQEALKQHANLFSDIEEAMTFSVELVHEKNKKALAEIGSKIKDVHIGKKEGLVDEERASTELDKLETDKDEINFRINLVRLLNVTADEIRAGVLFNEKGNPTKTQINQVISEVLARAGEEGAEALQQVYQMMESFSETADSISDIIVSDTDDFGITLAIGANPVGSCQHYETGQFRTALLSYFDSSTKLMVVKGQNDSFLSRAVLRLAEDNEGVPILVLEPTYSAVGSDDVQEAMIRHAKHKADVMGLQLLVPDTGEVSVSDIPKIKKASRMGTPAPFSYSDIFGGYKSQGEEKQKSSNVRKLKPVA